MKDFFYTIFLICISITSVQAQNTSYKSYENTLDSFAKASVNNLSFQNGIYIFIEKPESDEDALYKGFRVTHTDGEYNGGWEILAAKDIVIKEKIPLHFRAVLYLFKNKQYIALYKEDSNNKYYFRIFKAVYSSPRSTTP
ncbi:MULTISPECIES: hypothetical protein [unclassified Aureispira]|uniref:hypothetical protein n=1 Tax=unclassified Aureispira TaxID=2649989 RepID=UPI0006982F31|nr:MULTISPECIES: hypothetical protein [unclassified Aureispira]WMX15402.1 hypothetical protein QP953_03315 [Aureispira sp. CCB-E]